MAKIWFVNIIESERGWGQKIDETKEFFDYDSAIKFVREFNARNTNKTVPDWYMYAESPIEQDIKSMTSMTNELRIKSAAEYRKEQVTIETAAKEDLRSKVVEFINNVVTPTIEQKIANGWSRHTKHLSFDRVHYPMSEFVAEVKTILSPLGFTVYESHDGGGLYPTIEISWEE
jgi:hypothetical protein